MRDSDALFWEAQLFGRYFAGIYPVPLAAQLYVKAMSARPDVVISARDTRLLAFAITHPWSIGLLDAGLTLLNPSSEVKRRLYTMFSIMEAMPMYADDFLPQKRTGLFVLGIAVRGVIGITKTVAGAILVKVIA